MYTCVHAYVCLWRSEGNPCFIPQAPSSVCLFCFLQISSLIVLEPQQVVGAHLSLPPTHCHCDVTATSLRRHSDCKHGHWIWLFKWVLRFKLGPHQLSLSLAIIYNIYYISPSPPISLGIYQEAYLTRMGTKTLSAQVICLTCVAYRSIPGLGAQS